MSPPVGGNKNAGKTTTKNSISGGIGSANRSALGATCVSGDARDGGDPVGGNKQRCFEKYFKGADVALPTGKWLTIDTVSIMNSKNKADGYGYFSMDGKELARQNNVMWVFDPNSSPELWVRWRMMYGGNPEELPPAYDFKEWYKDFELFVIEN